MMNQDNQDRWSSIEVAQVNIGRCDTANNGDLVTPKQWIRDSRVLKKTD